MDASLLVVLAPWKTQPFEAAEAPGRARVGDRSPDELLHRALAPWPTDRQRISGHVRGFCLVDLLTPAAMLAVLDATLRGDGCAAGILLRPPADPRMDAAFVGRLAQKSPWGVAVRTDRRNPTAQQVDAALAAHATLLRQRSPATWRALDAVADFGTATAAARYLGCSQQAVSAQLARSNRVVTNQTRIVIEALLASR